MNNALNGSSSRFSYSTSTSFPSGVLCQVKGGSSKRVFWSHLSVDDEGTVTTNCVSNGVPWGELPARGNYTMIVHTAPVFNALPTSSDVHNRLNLTFLVLVLHCSMYNDVKQFRC